MAQVTQIEAFNWRKLESAIEKLTDAVNRNEPLEGDGIRISDGNGAGKIISVSSQGNAPSGTTTIQGGGAGVPVTIQAFDANNNPVTITVMTDGKGFSNSTLVWKPVAVVDPATCAQGTITVLEKSS